MPVTVCPATVGRLAQLEPHVDKLQQHSEDLRAELQASRQDNSSLSQQVAETTAAAAMHLAHQVRHQNPKPSCTLQLRFGTIQSAQVAACKSSEVNGLSIVSAHATGSTVSTQVALPFTINSPRHQGQNCGITVSVCWITTLP